VAGRKGQPRTYLAETYLARSSLADLGSVADRVAAAAAALTAAGRPVRYVRTVFVPGDETCFHFFEARALDDARAAAEEVEIDPDRVVEAHVLNQPQDTA
jgi:hypothetical protein